MTRFPQLTRMTAASLAATLLAAPLADAQSPDPTPRADPTSIWTIQDENATLSTAKLTDRYYVNGLRLGWTSGTDAVPDFLASAGRVVWGDGQQRIGFDLSQQIYTPADTKTRRPAPGDQPYSGVLLANLSLITDKADSRSILGASLGVIGPWALGEEVQNGFHDIIGQGHNNGWARQLRNEPAIELLSERTWRLPMGQIGGLETDALPNLAAGVGNVRIYAQTGVSFRLGQGLTSDYGVARINPGPSGGDAFTPSQPFAWYVFAGADGRAVGHDVTLNGNDFRDGPSVKPKALVGEGQAGFAIIAFGTRLTYTHVVQSQTFQHQKGGPHQMGSLALAVRF